MARLAKGLLLTSAIVFFHAAFSTYEHLSQLKALDRPQDHALPRDVIIESLAALIIGTLGAVLDTPAFKEITWSSEMKHRSFDEMDSRLGFINVNHKGRKLFASDH